MSPLRCAAMAAAAWLEAGGRQAGGVQVHTGQIFFHRSGSRRARCSFTLGSAQHQVQRKAKRVACFLQHKLGAKRITNSITGGTAHHS